jgi:AraC-like DNA-binding protein
MIQCQIVFIAQAALEVGVDPGTVARLGDTLQETVSEAFDYVRLEQLLYEAGARCCGLVAERYATSSNRLAAAADAYIEAHLSDADLGLAQIASYLGVSPSHLSRTYNRAVGCGITRTVNVRRVEAAKRRLIDSRDESVTQVAFDLGFGSVQHFGRAFREIAGVSPSEFRRAKIAR